MSEMDDLVSEFLVESQENLDRLDSDLVALEETPDDRDRIASIFRTIHTIKGTCGFLGFANLERVTHVGENLLSRLRDGELSMEEQIATALLEMVDAVRAMLDRIGETGEEGEEEYAQLVELLTRLQEGAGTSAEGGPEAEGTEASGEADPPREETADEVPEPSATQAQAPSGSSAEQGASAPPSRRSRPEQAIRVDVALLDTLMNLVGELVLTRNQIIQSYDRVEDESATAATQRLNLITSELQEGVMKTRMQPIGNLWNKLPRVVRDLAVSCGKRVQVVMEGKDTELDKTLIEAIKDPLTHIVRNSVDHGLETPEERLAGGKPEEGVLCLRAFHEGGQVNIEISDDGRGIDLERVRAKAVERGIISQERATRLSDKEVSNLVFSPGFSTAEKVTNVSGRGVGMDVVKSNIEKIGGSVDIQTEAGKGTAIRVKIPLTLAIVPALIVSSDHNRYAIPQVSLLELVRIAGSDEGGKIEYIHGVPVYRLRGKLLPLIYLREVFEEQAEEAREEVQRTVTIVVLHADGCQFGLVVDEVNDTEEIVVKPLGPQLKGLQVFAGATIMGDGRVALILDVLGIAQRAHLLGKGGESKPVEDTMSDASEHHGQRQNLLLVQLGEGRRVALPLDQVSRLEELPQENVEREGHQEVVQYRDEIMPLIGLDGFFGVASQPLEPDQKLQVTVHSYRGRSVGLVVDRILDIVEQTIELDEKAARAGVIGSAVVQDRVTEILDVDELVASSGVFPGNQLAA